MTDFRLSNEEIKKFKEKGYIGPFKLYSQEVMESILNKVRLQLLNTKKSIYRESSKNSITSFTGYDRHLDIDLLAEHIKKKEIVDKLVDILGENILCWRSEMFPKYPGDEGTDWHQSNTFTAVAGDKKPQIVWPENEGGSQGGAITVWTAFTDTNIDNGCLQFIPGTHTGMYFDESKEMNYDKEKINSIEKNGTKRGFFGYDFNDLKIDESWTPDEDKAESMIMKAGEFIIFWSSLMHASHDHKGLTNDIRLGYAARYVPTYVKVYPYSNELKEFGEEAKLTNHHCVLVSGKNNFSFNVVK